MKTNSNSQQFHFHDFTLHNYVSLLKRAQEFYNFESFTDSIPPGSIILRHDIDLSILHAFKMAQIEEMLGIKATYFVQLHSEFYNPLDKTNFGLLRRILDMGHKLGLHFDTHFWGINSEDQLEKFISFDKELLENIFEIEIDVFSFHNNNEFTLQWSKNRIAGLINVYSSYFKEMGYCSDSVGYWRYDRLEDILKPPLKFDRLQILIHPCWWQERALPPRQRIYNLIDDNNTYLKRLWDSTLKQFGAKNIDWEEIY